jgi:hypothetical protein
MRGPRRGSATLSDTGRPREEGIFLGNPNIATPATPTSSYYFWAISRPYGLDDPSLSSARRRPAPPIGEP